MSLVTESSFKVYERYLNKRYFFQDVKAIAKIVKLWSKLNASMFYISKTNQTNITLYSKAASPMAFLLLVSLLRAPRLIKYCALNWLFLKNTCCQSSSPFWLEAMLKTILICIFLCLACEDLITFIRVYLTTTLDISIFKHRTQPDVQPWYRLTVNQILIKSKARYETVWETKHQQMFLEPQIKSFRKNGPVV